MRDRFDTVWSQFGYYVDEMLLRVGLDRDDPAVDTRRRGIIAIVVSIIIALLGIWWYGTHVLVTSLEAVQEPAPATETIHTPPPVTTHSQQPAPPTHQPASAATSRDTRQTQPSASAENCDPNYSPCVPYAAGDLDCKDIGQTVQVVGVDRYYLDRDHDGYGCDK